MKTCICCGTKNANHANFCQECGMPFSNFADPKSVKSREQISKNAKRKQKMKVLAAIMICLVAKEVDAWAESDILIIP